MRKFSLVSAVLLIGVNSWVTGWMKPRPLRVMDFSSNRVQDDRCKQFQFFTQRIDHLGFDNMDTFQQRYIINKDYWQSGQPIFFYTGNEGWKKRISFLVENEPSMFR